MVLARIVGTGFNVLNTPLFPHIQELGQVGFSGEVELWTCISADRLATTYALDIVYAAAVFLILYIQLSLTYLVIGVTIASPNGYCVASVTISSALLLVIKSFAPGSDGFVSLILPSTVTLPFTYNNGSCAAYTSPWSDPSAN